MIPDNPDKSLSHNFSGPPTQESRTHGTFGFHLLATAVAKRIPQKKICACRLNGESPRATYYFLNDPFNQNPDNNLMGVVPSARSPGSTNDAPKSRESCSLMQLVRRVSGTRDGMQRNTASTVDDCPEHSPTSQRTGRKRPRSESSAGVVQTMLRPGATLTRLVSQDFTRGVVERDQKKNWSEEDGGGVILKHARISSVGEEEELEEVDDAMSVDARISSEGGRSSPAGIPATPSPEHVGGDDVVVSSPSSSLMSDGSAAAAGSSSRRVTILGPTTTIPSPSGSPFTLRSVVSFDHGVASNDGSPSQDELFEVPRTVSFGGISSIKTPFLESEVMQKEGSVSSKAAPFPNPLHTPSLVQPHLTSLRLESSLLPLRPLLARLMSHPTHNRRGTFNSPVDPIALGLDDYNTVISNPMDLGTVKARLHSLSYSGPEEVARDVRLVFGNAMRYNPPGHVVHVAAEGLLRLFEEGYAAASAVVLSPKSGESESVVVSGTMPSHSLQEAKVVAALTASSPVASAPIVEARVVSFASDPSLPAGATTTATTTRTTSAKPAPSPRLSFLAHPTKRHHPSPSNPPHSCQDCQGRICHLCNQGCLHHEPTLLICAGSSCHGTKMRRGAPFYTTPDGSRLWCQRCYSNLSAVLPSTGEENSDGSARYKRELLKRKNEEEVVERWVNCVDCKRGTHGVCAMYNEKVHDARGFVCPPCVARRWQGREGAGSSPTRKEENVLEARKGLVRPVTTFLSGAKDPVVIDTTNSNTETTNPNTETGQQQHSCFQPLSAESLPHTDVSRFIERKIQERMVQENCPPNAEHTVLVRLVSDCEKYFHVPDVVRRHFRMVTKGANDRLADGDGGSEAMGCLPPPRSGVSASRQSKNNVPLPKSVRYNSKAIALFQKIDGIDVCVFCMYVQEYDNDADEYEWDDNSDNSIVIKQQRRVYVAYLDSVEYFRPRRIRTAVYHELLVSYLATARARGFETAHIWACPPSRGNSFVFWNHPPSQRTPTRERLVAWYHGALSRAVECGVVTDVRSLYEHSFGRFKGNDNSAVKSDDEGAMVCPPLLDGDYWIEEAVRMHAAAIARHLKSKGAKIGGAQTPKMPPADNSTHCTINKSCPAMEVSSLIQNRILSHPSSNPFHRPVNAAALNLRDYHQIITKPMDLGTVHARLLLGEFDTLRDLVSDVKLVFDNAMRYNPKGHFVHTMAAEMWELFLLELGELTKRWLEVGLVGPRSSTGVKVEGGWQKVTCQGTNLWEECAGVSMHLNTFFGEIRSMQVSVPSTASPPCTTSLPETSPQQAGVDAPLSTSKTIAPSTSCKPKLDKPSPPGENKTKRDDPRTKGTAATSKLDLFSGGPEAIARRMLGDDASLVNKSHSDSHKKKKGSKKKKKPSSCADEATSHCGGASKRRKQSWLCDEVSDAIRQMRTAFFVCDLVPTNSEMISEAEMRKMDEFDAYTVDFEALKSDDRAQRGADNTAIPKQVTASGVADARHALLEFSQYRNFEFDTLRRAKYSTSMLLYHLLHPKAPGLVPTCTSCRNDITTVRWHRVKNSNNAEQRKQKHGGGVGVGAGGVPVLAQTTEEKLSPCDGGAEELCGSCHTKVANSENYIPLRVSFQRSRGGDSSVIIGD